MKENFERVVQAAEQRLDDRLQRINKTVQCATKEVMEAKGKLTALKGFIDDLDMDKLARWDPILVGTIQGDPGKPAGEIRDIRLDVSGTGSQQYVDLDTFHQGKPIPWDRPYRVVVMLQPMD